MRRWKQWLALLAAVLLLTGCASGTAGPGRDGGNLLRVGVRTDILDFSYYNEQAGKYYGLEIDLADEIARRMGYDGVEYIAVTAEGREELLQSGQADCLLACLTVTAERVETMDFSAPYYHDSVRLLVQDSSLYTRARSLRDGTVGVLSGSVAADTLLRAFYKLGIVSEYDPEQKNRTQYDGVTLAYGASYDALAEMLERGEIDALCADGCITKAYLTGERHYIDLETPKFAYAAATRKGSPLSGPVAQAVEEMLADGTVDRLVDKWS